MVITCEDALFPVATLVVPRSRSHHGLFHHRDLFSVRALDVRTAQHPALTTRIMGTTCCMRSSSARISRDSCGMLDPRSKWRLRPREHDPGRRPSSTSGPKQVGWQDAAYRLVRNKAAVPASSSSRRRS